MKFKCENCGTRYNIADHKVRNKVLKIRCKVCEHVIILREPEAAAPEPSPSAELEWYLAVDGQQLGPMPFERLRDRIRRGELSPDDVVWNASMADWRPISEVAALAPLTKRTPIPLPPRPSMVGRRPAAEDAATIQRTPSAADVAALEARRKAEAEAKARAAAAEAARRAAHERAEAEARERAAARKREAEAAEKAKREAAERVRLEAAERARAVAEAAERAKAEAEAAERAEAEAAQRAQAEAARRAQEQIESAFEDDDDATAMVPTMDIEAVEPPEAPAPAPVDPVVDLGRDRASGVVSRKRRSKKQRRADKRASRKVGAAAPPTAPAEPSALPPLSVVDRGSAPKQAPPAPRLPTPAPPPAQTEAEAGPTELVPILPPDTSVNPVLDDQGHLVEIESLAGVMPAAEAEVPIRPIITPTSDSGGNKKLWLLMLGAALLLGAGVAVGIMFRGDPPERTPPDAAVAVAVVDAGTPATPDAAVAKAPEPDAAVAKAPVPDAAVAVKPAPKKKKDAGTKKRAHGQGGAGGSGAVAAAKRPTKSRFSDLKKTREDTEVMKVAAKRNLPETLSSGQISTVIKRYQRSVHGCYQRQLKRDPSMSNARAMLRFTIQPSGKTSNVRLDRKFNGTVLKSCLQSTVRRWSFPEFTGKSIPVEYPLIFQASL